MRPSSKPRASTGCTRRKPTSGAPSKTSRATSAERGPGASRAGPGAGREAVAVADTRLFVDFGSTFTKLVAFDLEGEELLARVQVPSTVGHDITVGLEQAFSLLSETVPIGESERRRTVACSSAAGGLRVVCVGLVPEYTTEAGRRAALGAGAKIVGSYSFELSEAETREIEDIAPDIVLLTGGTDGGNKKVITHNAAMLGPERPRA